MKNFKSGLTVLFFPLFIFACNGGGSSSSGSQTPTSTSISVVAPFGTGSAAYVAAGSSLYSTDGTTLTALGTTPNGAAITQIQPFGTGNSAYVAAGSSLYLTIGGFLSNPVDTISTPGAVISLVQPYGLSGSAYVAVGATLYSTTGAMLSSVGVTPNHQVISQIAVYGSDGEAYVAAGNALYTATDFSISPFGSLTGMTPNNSNIAQILLIGNTGLAYVAAGSSLYSTSTGSLTSIGVTNGPAISEEQLVPSTQSACVVASSSVYFTNGTADGKSLNLVDTESLTAGSAPVSAVQLFGVGSAFVASGSTLFSFDAATPANPIKLGATQNNVVVINLLQLDGTGSNAFAVAGSSLYTTNGADGTNLKLIGSTSPTASPSPSSSQTPSPPTPNVSVTSPVANSTVSSPFNIIASCGTSSVTAIQAYVDGVVIYNANATSMNDQATASAGTHQLEVKCWVGATAYSSGSSSFTVTAPSGFNGSSNIPNPPSSATDDTSIQNLTGWSSSTGALSACPDGITSPTCNPPNANYSAEFSGSDSSAVFQLKQSPAYATVVWGHSLQTSTTVQNFIWDFSVYVDATNYGSSELDLYTTLNNGQRFMMGSQCNRANNTWDTWSEANQTWIHNSSIACNQILTPGAWHRVSYYLTVNPTANSYTYHVIRIDGIDYVLNQTQNTKYVGWPEGLIGVQVQLDANSSGNGVNEYIENMQLYTW